MGRGPGQPSPEIPVSHPLSRSCCSIHDGPAATSQPCQLASRLEHPITRPLCLAHPFPGSDAQVTPALPKKSKRPPSPPTDRPRGWSSLHTTAPAHTPLPRLPHSPGLHERRDSQKGGEPATRVSHFVCDERHSSRDGSGGASEDTEG